MARKDKADKAKSRKRQRGVNAQLAAQYGDAYNILGGVNGSPAGTYIPPGSLSGVRREWHVTTARSEGTMASSDQRNWGEYGAGNIPSKTNKPGV